MKATRLVSAIAITGAALSGCAPLGANIVTLEPSIAIDLEQRTRVSTNPLSLSDGIRLGILNSNNILTADILIRQSMNEAVIARGAYFPELYVEVSPGSESNVIGAGGAGLRYTIFDFGARAAQLKATGAGVTRASFEQIVETESTAVDVALGYIDVVVDQEQIRAAEAYLVAVRDLQDGVRTRVEIGIASAIDQSVVDAGLIAANVEVVSAKSRAEASLATVESTVGISVASVQSTAALRRLLNASGTELPSDLSEFARYSALEAQVTEAQHALDAREAGLLPRIGVRVGVGAGIDVNQGVVGTGLVAGPEISNTFSLGGARAAQVENAKFDVAIAEQMLEEEERSLQLHYNTAQIELAATLRRIDSQLEILKLTRERLDIMKSEYEIGNRDLQDLIQAERAIHDTQVEINETYRDNLRAHLNMLVTANLLSERLFNTVDPA